MKAIQGFMIDFGDSIVRNSQFAYQRVTALFQTAHAEIRGIHIPTLSTKKICYLLLSASSLTGAALMINFVVPPIFISLVVVGTVAINLLLFEFYRNFRPLVAQPLP